MQKMILRQNPMPMMSKLMIFPLAMVVAAEASNISPHVAGKVVNSPVAEELRGGGDREDGGPIVTAVKSVKKITSHQNVLSCATQRQINMSWLQLFRKISNPDHV